MSPTSTGTSAVDTDGGSVETRVRRVLAERGRLGVSPEALADGDDLYAAGLSSRASVDVMLALEREFDLEFPDDLLRRDVFASVAAIAAAVRRLQDEA